MAVQVTITIDERGNAALQATPTIVGNRIALYGILQMGLELVHRMGDQQPPPNNGGRIVIPEIRLP
jgi:hypothetical protein